MTTYTDGPIAVREMALHGQALMLHDAATGEWHVLEGVADWDLELEPPYLDDDAAATLEVRPIHFEAPFRMVAPLLSPLLQVAVMTQARQHPAFQWRPKSTPVMYGECGACGNLKPLCHDTIAPHSLSRLLLVMCAGSNEPPTAGPVPDPGGQPCPRHGDWYLETMTCTCGPRR